ncbi:MAG: T9SS type A sorting domain-containing protein [Flavobacteriales bacterium]
MKTLFTLLITVLFLSNSYTQVSWSYRGDYREIHGIYDSNHFAVYNNARQNVFTQDGGTTWQNSGFTVSSKMYYRTTNNIFIMARNGNNFDCKESTDGGLTYTLKGQLLPSGFSPNAVFELFFFDQNNGLAVSRSVVNGNVLDVMHRTSNGGTSWSYATSDSSLFDNYEDVLFYKSGVVRVYGNGSIHESKDMGNTWKNIGSNPLYSSGHFGGNGLEKSFGAGWAGSSNPCVVKSTDSARTFNSWNGIPDTANGGVILCSSALHPVNLLYNTNGEMMVHGIRWLGSRTNITIYSKDDGVTWQEATYGTGYETETLRLADDGKTFVNHTYNAKFWTLGGGSSSTTNLQDLKKEQIKVYPNPTTDRITVFNQNSIYNTLEIYDLSGKQLVVKQLSFEKETFDLTSLNKGVYIMRLSNSDDKLDSTYLSKIIKQ